MKKSILIFIAGFGILVLFATCKKYPEGGYTKRAPKFIPGTWQLTLYEVNGVDSTDLINYMNDENYKNVSISKNGSTLSFGYEGYKGNSAKLIDNNQKILFYVGNTNSGKSCLLYNSINYCYRAFLSPELSNDPSTEWKILKLTKTEMALSCSLINRYVLKFSKR
jgi:hypothetical protein